MCVNCGWFFERFCFGSFHYRWVCFTLSPRTDADYRILNLKPNNKKHCNRINIIYEASNKNELEMETKTKYFSAMTLFIGIGFDCT